MQQPRLVRGRLTWSVPVAPESSPQTSDEDLLTAFGHIRSYVEEENKLVSERISRTLLVHGFLIASFVLLIQAKAQSLSQVLSTTSPAKALQATEIGKGKGYIDLQKILDISEIVLPLISLMGVLTGLAALVSVLAAGIALGGLYDKAQALQQAHLEQWHRLSLPEVTGGGRALARFLGRAGAEVFLFLLFLFWVRLLLLSAGGKPFLIFGTPF